VAIAATCGALTFGYRYLSFEEFSNDHFVHLSSAQQIVLGALPVRDFVESGIPLMSALSAGAQLALGEGLRSELMFIAAAFALAASLTFVLCARLGRSIVIGAVAVLVPVLAHPISYSYIKQLAPAIGLVAALSYSRQPTVRRLLLVAVAIAFAFLLRHDLAVFVGLGVVALLAAQHGIGRRWLIETGRVAIAAVLLLSPYLVWVQVYQGVGDYVRQGIAFSRREAEKANWWQSPRLGVDSSQPFLSRLVGGPVVNVRWRPDATEPRIVEAEQQHGLIRLDLNSPQSWQYMLTDWSAAALQALVRDPLVADTHGIDRTTFALQVPAPRGLRALGVHVYGPGPGLRLPANLFGVLFYSLWLLPVAACVALLVTWRQSSPERRGLIAMVIAVQLSMNLTMLRDPLDTRVRDVLVPAAVLMAYLAGLGWSVPSALLSAGGVVRRGLILAALAIEVASAASIGGMPDKLERTQVARGVTGIRERARTIRRRFAPPDQRTGPRSPVYAPVVEYLVRCTSPQARLLMLTNAPELLFYSRRGFAGGHVSLDPGFFSTDRDAASRLSRVLAEDVPLVIMDSQTEREMIDGYPRIGAHVRQHYHEVERFPISSDKAFVVLARNDRPACARLE
jgi:hypothetical protein